MHGTGVVRRAAARKPGGGNPARHRALSGLKGHAMTTTFDLQTFREFMKAREDAARAYVTGRPDLELGLCAESGAASLFDARGGAHSGAAAVQEATREGATRFAGGGRTWFEVLDQQEADGLAYWSGYEMRETAAEGTTPARKKRLRVTEVFRATAEGWKRVHRHASPAAE
jgi:ketosteroid isomerase-like protein